MRKLEIKDLKMFLDHNLPVMDLYTNKPAVLYGLDTADEENVLILRKVIHQRNLDEIKPILKSLYDLTKDDWMDVFKAGFDAELLKIMSEFDLDIFINSGVVRLYNKRDGFKANLPAKTLVSFNFGSNQFNTIWRFFLMDSLNELYKKHADVGCLIENNLAINIKSK